MLLLGWSQLLQPPSITAIAGLITAITGLVAALRAQRKARGASRTANTTRAESAKSLPPLYTKSERNAALIEVLNNRISSLEQSFHALLKVMEGSGWNGGPHPLPPSPTGGDEPPGPTG